MTTLDWTGQELFSWDGTFVFIGRRVETERVTIHEYPSGRYMDVVDENLLESASPEELDEVV